MRILYGVVGEGMGHATRSRVVIEHLIEAGHEVEIVVSGRAHGLLQEAFGSAGGAEVRRIHGLTMVYADNEVQKRLTVLSNLQGLNEGLPGNVATYFRSIEGFSPDVVISDFESWSYLYGKIHRVPVISIDNMQVINRCQHPDELLAGNKKAFLLSKAIVKSKLPGAHHYFATTFFFPPTRKDRTTLVPPILRPEVFAAKLRAEQNGTGDHVLVYQSGESHGALVDVMQSFNETEFRVYGLRRGIDKPVREGNLLFCPFSERGFIDDLATARAVIAGGGFSLMGECVFLGRPLLSVPLAGQFEQVLNAGWLQHLGYGLRRDHIERADVAELLQRSDELAQTLAAHQQDGNGVLMAALDEQLATIAGR
jgi:uncharacterized protein (TIGR00661 family)